MIKNNIYLLICMVMALNLSAQVPSVISVSGESTPKLVGCADQFAGNVFLDGVSAQSKQINLQQVSFLCANDQFTVRNEDANLTGDPNNTTPPGIAYAFYKCTPTVTGAQLVDIQNDPCVLDVPVPGGAYNLWLYRDQINGTALFQNGNQVGGQSIPEFFNAGKPLEITFAPITIDDFYGLNDEDGGDCVHVNTGASFAVVYLNPIKITGLTLNVGGNPLQGSFTIEGGLPEYDPSTNYEDILIVKDGNINVKAQLIGGPYKHGDLVTFLVPEEGDYTLFVEDEMSCGYSESIKIYEDIEELTISIDMGPDIVENGDEVCAKFSVKDFDKIENMQFTINFDPNVLKFKEIKNFNLTYLDLGNFNTITTNQGYLGFIWGNKDPENAISLPDGTTIFEICFDVVGQPGDCSNVFINGYPVIEEIANQDGEYLDLIVVEDKICVKSKLDLEIITGVCGANGSQQGSLRFKFIGGNPNYNYTILPSGTNGVMSFENTDVQLNNLAAGTYTINVTDANGNTASKVIEVSDGPSIDFGIEASDPTCFAGINGKLKITNLTGGVPDYKIKWSNNVANVDSIKKLPGGTYFVTIEDSNGCKATQQVVIGKNPLKLESMVTDTATCSNLQDGTIVLKGKGGTAGMPDDTYSFKWKNPSKKDNNVNVSTNTNIGSGWVQITLTDDNGCTIRDSVFMPIKKVVLIDYEIDKGPCDSGPGSITVKGGTSDNSCSNYSFKWSPNAGVTTSLPAESTATNLDQGLYSVTVTDCDGCAVAANISLNLIDPLKVVGLPSFDCGKGTGCLNLFAQPNAAGPFTFAWEDGSDKSTNCDLAPGDYIVTVTGNNGCFVVDTFTIVENFYAIDAINKKDESCAGAMDGEIQLVAGGNPTFSWEGPNGIIPGNQSTISSLGAGKYYFTVTDAQSNCTIVDSVDILAAEAILVGKNITPISCNGEKDGAIDLTISGGTAINGYNITWKNLANTTSTINNLGTGTYYAFISDDNNCMVSDTTFLEDPAKIGLQINVIEPIQCSYDTDAIVEVVANGGKVNDGNYGFTWSSLEKQNISSTNVDTSFLSAPPNGFVIVHDAECSDTINFTLEVPDEIKIVNSSQIEDVSCYGLCDGRANISVSGGTGSFSYTWQGTNNTNNIEENLCVGYHRVQIVDGNGCIKMDSVQINQPDSLILGIDNAQTFSPSCAEDTNGQIATTVSGGNSGDFQYAWTNQVSTVYKAGNLKPGIYTITVTDNKGCTDTATYDLSAAPPIVGSFTDTEPILCYGNQTCLRISNVAGGAGEGYRFSVNNGVLYDIDTCINIFAGSYDLKIYDKDGCSKDTTIYIDQPAENQASLGDDIVVKLGDTTTVLSVELTTGFVIDTIIWNSEEPFNCITNDCSKIKIYPTKDTKYSVMVFDENGCKVSDEIFIRLDDERRIYIPNIFSPNNDGANDFFKPHGGFGVDEIKVFRIYDRWGNLIFERLNYKPNSTNDQAWDGRMNGQLLDPGVYAYLIEAKFNDGKIITYSGSITLVR